MIIDPAVTAAADEFWESVGKPASFPRELEPNVFVGLPLAVVRLPRLRRSTAAAWLSERRVRHGTGAPDERLHGYLVARGGAGVAFLDGTDPPDEQRFSLAHEIAHFLNDYLRPRAEALRACGARIQEVLDGQRPPTAGERLTGILRGVPLGGYCHSGRPSVGHAGEPPALLSMEDRADRLALEILAPIASVMGLLRDRVRFPVVNGTQNKIGALLCEHYGLPPVVADVYGRVVLGALRSRRSFRQWIGA